MADLRLDMAWADERRTERLHVRVSPAFKHRLAEAARETGMNTSDFVVAAVTDRVDEALMTKTVVEADYFERLLAELDRPARTLPRLAEAARRHDERATRA